MRKFINIVEAASSSVVAYHGSRVKFDAFDISKVNYTNTGRAIYLSSSKEEAVGYSKEKGYLYTVAVDATNVLPLNNNEYLYDVNHISTIVDDPDYLATLDRSFPYSGRAVIHSLLKWVSRSMGLPREKAWDEVHRILRVRGFTAIVFVDCPNDHSGGKSDFYVVLDPSILTITNVEEIAKKPVVPTIESRTQMDGVMVGSDL